jgi:Protein of unknown function (DUF2628)
MAFYTVLTPPHDPLVSPADQQGRTMFLKDGFVLFAFIFTGLWLLSKRLWLAFAIFLAIWAAIGFGGRAIGINPMGLLLAQALIGLFLGLEGHALLESKLLRKGWTLAGVVEGRDIDTVERRFFESLPPMPDAVPMRAYPPSLTPQTTQGVLGLFPDARAR